MKQRGRKSAFSRVTPEPLREVEVPNPPEILEPAARVLWEAIVESRPPKFFASADLPLLREYCHTIETLVPIANAAISDGDLKALDTRDKLVRLAASLAGKLRLCVSSRTRPDTASMRDSVRSSPPPWERI